MKILHLTTHFNTGGITRYIVMIGSAMARRGHEVWVASSGGALEEEAAAQGLRCVRFPIRTKNEFHPKLFFALPSMIGLVKREKFDLIHAHTRVAEVLSFFISMAARIPVVTTAHGFYKSRFSRRILPAWGERVIAVSDLVGAELEKTHRVPKSKIRVVPNAIDVEALRERLRGKNPAEIRRRLGIGDRAFVIGAISRLVDDKGHAVLLEAAARLKKQGRDLFLLIVGDGREKRRLEKLVRKLHLERQTRFIPSTPDVTEVLAVLDVFAHPATYREGFGLAMLEAMAAKVPVVATDIWAINSIIRNRVNGFLVAPKDARALAEAIGFVMQNPENAGTIAENASQMVSRFYSIDRAVNETETVYSEVVRRG